MVNKIKKIWFLCLCLTSLSLSWCFHVPYEDWLPSRGKVKTEYMEKDDEFKQALDSFINDFNTISDQRTKMKNNENNWVDDGDLEKASINTDDEVIYDEDVVNEEDVIKKEENDK